jgi:hypothetical protein
MLSRHAVLLTSSECAVPGSVPISIQIASLTPLEYALTSYSQLIENTAALSLLECAVPRFSPAIPLECAVTKNTGAISFKTKALLSPRPSTTRPPVSDPSSIFRTLFQVPYPVSPAFATLTKTAGVWGYSSHSGTRHLPLPFATRHSSLATSSVSLPRITVCESRPFFPMAGACEPARVYHQVFLSTLNCRLSTSSVPLPPITVHGTLATFTVNPLSATLTQNMRVGSGYG